jgi:aminomethyltransferase
MNNAEDRYAGERLKKTHFYPRAEPMNIRNAWSSWNGYKFAEYYYDAQYEYFCVRNSCAT